MVLCGSSRWVLRYFCSSFPSSRASYPEELKPARKKNPTEDARKLINYLQNWNSGSAVSIDFAKLHNDWVARYPNLAAGQYQSKDIESINECLTAIGEALAQCENLKGISFQVEFMDDGTSVDDAQSISVSWKLNES